MATFKSRATDVEDWLEVFDAIIRMKPTDIRSFDTIEHVDAIRAIGHRALENIEKEMKAVQAAQVPLPHAP